MGWNLSVHQARLCVKGRLWSSALQFKFPGDPKPKYVILPLPILLLWGTSQEQLRWTSQVFLLSRGDDSSSDGGFETRKGRMRISLPFIVLW